MGNGKRDAAELAAAVDAGIRKGLDLPTHSAEHRLVVENSNEAKEVLQIPAGLGELITFARSSRHDHGGTAVSASAATAGIIDVAATGVTGAGWFAALPSAPSQRSSAGVPGGGCHPSRQFRRSRSGTCSSCAIGYDSVARYTAVRVQTVQVIHAIAPLHHDAARELRAADLGCTHPQHAGRASASPRRNGTPHAGYIRGRERSTGVTSGEPTT